MSFRYKCSDYKGIIQIVLNKIRIRATFGCIGKSVERIITLWYKGLMNASIL